MPSRQKSKSRSHSSGSHNGAKPVKLSAAVDSFEEVRIPKSVPNLNTINNVDTVMEYLNEYYDAKNQYEINSVVLNNFAKFLDMYHQSFTAERKGNMTQFSAGFIFKDSGYNNPKLISVLGDDEIGNLESSPKAWKQLHDKSLKLSISYLEKSNVLMPKISQLQKKLIELTSQNSSSNMGEQTHLGGGRKKKYSLKKRRTQ